MYKFDITQSFDKESGLVGSKITVIQTDPGLPHNIIKVGDSLTNSTTLWAETWEKLEKMEESFIHKLKLAVDRMRKAREKAPYSRTVNY